MKAKVIILNSNENKIKCQKTGYRKLLQEKLYDKNFRAGQFIEKGSELIGDKLKLEVRKPMLVLIGVENNCS